MKTIVSCVASFVLGGLIVFFVMKNGQCPANDPKIAQLEKSGNLEKFERFDSVANGIHHAAVNIGFSAAQHLVQQYKPNAIADRVDDDGSAIKGNTLTVWYDVTTIAELYNLVLSTPNGDGIRLYFATYDNQFHGVDSRGVKHTLSNANTIVMVPTYTKQVGNINYHWDLDQAVAGNMGIGVLADYENKGELCPPPAGCQLTGATLLSTAAPLAPSAKLKSE